MLKKTSFAVALALAAAATTASADTVNANVVYDLSVKVNNTTNSWNVAFDSLTSAVSVDNGDTVVINISFLPGQSLQWTGHGSINPWLGIDGVNVFSWSNASINFLGLVGPNLLTPIFNGSSCCAHIGPTYAIQGDDQAREFTGLSVTFDVGLSGGPMNFDQIGWTELFEWGTVHAVSSQNNVPEPATLSLLALAVAGLGAGRWRKAA